MAFLRLGFSKYRGPVSDTVQLLVVQPTPFCNIDCDYCYLPNRISIARLSVATFRQVLTKLFDSGLVKDQLNIVWHAGEPMTLPVSYYKNLFDSIDELGIPRSSVRHSIQTNAMLITDLWCDFIREHDINIGVSLDGPGWLHDLHRRDRQGRGTYERVLKGVNCLKAHNIDFHVIAVVTSNALDCADEIFDFFLGLGISRVGFNVEELEGEHRTSSLRDPTMEDRVRGFLTRLFSRQQTSRGVLRIREFERAYESIVSECDILTADESMRRTSQVSPLAIITVDWSGNLSSFSPELLGVKSAQYGDFRFGNIQNCDFSQVSLRQMFNKAAADIYAGVKLCQRSCQYFSLCGGGAPANKYFENGSFVSTETMYCRTSIQMPIDIVLADLEKQMKSQ